jgi:hypothetical protein
LATAGIIIFILNFSMRETTPVLAAKAPPPAPEVLVKLRQEHKLHRGIFVPEVFAHQAA